MMNSDLREQFILLMTKCSKFNSTVPSLCGLPLNEMEILHIISENDDCDGSEGIHLDIPGIQKRLQISKPAISYNLNLLEEKEYIVREIDPKDRRRISVHVTKEGISAWELSKKKHEDIWDRLSEEYGEENLEELTKLLTEFFEAVDHILAEEL